MSQLDEVERQFTAAGIQSERREGYLDLYHGLRVRVMEDPGHPDRVHLRSVTTDGQEVTVSTQRMSKLRSLVSYAVVLVRAAERDQ
jgi:hypothetical protein